MPFIGLNLHERPPRYPPRRAAPLPFRLDFAQVPSGLWPGRGLLYAFLAHEIALFSLIMLPSFAPPRKPRIIPEQVVVLDLDSPEALFYFPELNRRNDTGGPARKGTRAPSNAEPSNAEPANNEGLREKGRSYPGPQEIVSEVPKATNRFQTLLQPTLEKPPVIQPPIPLPNIIQMANAGPLTPPPPPTLAPRPEPKPAALLPTPEPRIEPKPAAPPPAPLEQVKLLALSTPDDQTIPAPPPLRVSPRPELVLPTAPPPPVAPAPPAPAPPPPAAVAPAQEKVVERPAPPKDIPVPAPSPAPPPAKVAPPTPAPVVPIVPPPQIAAVESQGPDRQSLLSVTPLPAPAQPSVRVPAVEARGRVAISPEPNLTASARELGGSSNKPPTNPNAGAAKEKATESAAGTATVANAGRAANPAADKEAAPPANAGDKLGGAAPKDLGSANATPNSKGDANGAGPADGRGNASGATPAKSPFTGITIQGGRLEGAATTGVVNLSAAPRTGTVTLSNSAPPVAPKAPYGITITSTATSGGGLPNLGVFSNEPVYTVYMDMLHPNGSPAPSWTLQYALTLPVVNPSGLVPPFPIAKEQPVLPVELVRKYPRQLVIVYAIIDKEGKLQQTSIKQSPDPELNPLVLAALSRWTFRPAEVKGSPVSAKILLGIPLSLPPQ